MSHSRNPSNTDTLAASPRKRRREGNIGFTLIEILVATTVLTMLVILLSSVLSSALEIWQRGMSKSEVREGARSVIELMTSELRQAVLPLDRTATDSLQFIVNPPDLDARFMNRDSLFWQAPLAHAGAAGDMAVVGYFVKKVEGRYKLCRIFINPGDANYAIYSAPDNWLSDGMLDAIAPADEASFLKGVVLENVPGMWVTAYQDSSTSYATYDSRAARRLPERVDISLILLDERGATLSTSGVISLPPPGGYANADAYMAALSERARAHAQLINFSVSLTP